MSQSKTEFPAWEMWKTNSKKATQDFAKAVAERFMDGMGAAGKAVTGLKDLLVNGLTRTGDAIKSAFVSMGSAFKSLWEGFRDTVTKIAKAVDSKLGISEKAKAVGDACKQFFSKVAELGTAAGKSIVEKSKAAGQTVGSFMKKNVVDPLSKAVGAVGKVFGRAQ